jgi:UDP-N-acetylglucosamine 1-carboxyvinyltransferase
MGIFKIEGIRLGEITPQGAKNEALQILCAVLLTQKKINNIPDIDINKLITLLENLGVNIQKMDRVLILFRLMT